MYSAISQVDCMQGLKSASSGVTRVFGALGQKVRPPPKKSRHVSPFYLVIYTIVTVVVRSRQLPCKSMIFI